jgi:hypothetical protein
VSEWHLDPPTSHTATAGLQSIKQNQHVTNSDSSLSIQNALNAQLNIDSNTVGGTSPTTQSIIGGKQTLGLSD